MKYRLLLFVTGGKMITEKVFLHNLGKEICEARKRLNMSQAELAEKADLSVTYVSKIECG